ncbi:hypothetical protein [Pseudomonas donghuensis]|uniref:hypothetical protein n=1 Tax=Pseudomonas donghuensis TaxID=1163398 RepID=UPI002E1293B1|nr:hypothetical protein VP780_24625 [Pseudomonas donghuensis]
MIRNKTFGALQLLKRVLFTVLALLSCFVIPLVWVPLIVGDWFLGKFRQRR